MADIGKLLGDTIGVSHEEANQGEPPLDALETELKDAYTMPAVQQIVPSGSVFLGHKYKGFRAKRENYILWPQI